MTQTSFKFKMTQLSFPFMREEKKRLSCNMHGDCAAAEEKAKLLGVEERRYDRGFIRLERGRFARTRLVHCWDEDCEDCFGF